MNFRKYETQDVVAISKIICETWDFHELSTNTEVAFLAGNIYLYEYLSNQNFTLVAVQNDVPVGILVGDIKEMPKRDISQYRHKLNEYYTQMLQYPEGKFILDKFAGIKNLGDKLLQETGKNHDAQLALFITNKVVRGRNIGTSLYEQFVKECQRSNCKNLYLYTDSVCNFEFYEHREFVRINEGLYSDSTEQFEFYVYEKSL